MNDLESRRAWRLAPGIHVGLRIYAVAQPQTKLFKVVIDFLPQKVAFCLIKTPSFGFLKLQHGHTVITRDRVPIHSYTISGLALKFIMFHVGVVCERCQRQQRQIPRNRDLISAVE